MLKYLLLPVLITLGLTCGPVGEEAEANKRFVEAVTLLEAAESEPYAPTKLALLEQAETTLQAIITRYPSTPLAVKLASGQQIGNVSLATIATAVEAARGPACQVTPTSACVIAQALALAQTLDGSQGSQTPESVADLKKLLEQTLDGSQRSQTLYHITERLTNIALVQAQAGNRVEARKTITQALALAQTLPDEKRCTRLTQIAPAQVQAGDRTGAQATLAQAAALAQAHYEDEEVRDTFLAYIAAQAGNYAEARAIIARTVALAQTLDAKDQVWLFALIARTQAQIGDRTEAQATVAQALAFVQTLTNEQERDRNLAPLLAILIEAGDTVQAQALAQIVTDEEMRAKFLAGIATAQAHAGDHTEAQETASQALALARTFTDEEMRVYMLAYILPALAQAGDHAEARATIAWVLARTQILSKWGRPDVLSHIAQAQAYVGDGVKALALVQTLTNAGDDPWMDKWMKGERAKALAGIALARVAAADAQEADFWNWVNSFW